MNVFTEDLLRVALSSYFTDFIVLRRWETIDKHSLALVNSQRQTFILKSPFPYSTGAYYARSHRSLVATADYLRLCDEKGFPVPEYIRNRAGDDITAVGGGRYCYVMRYIDHREDLQFNRQHLFQLAGLQAKLHTLSSQFPCAGPRRHRLTLIDFMANVEKLHKHGSSEVAAGLCERGISELGFLRECFEWLPKGICHNDLGVCNVLLHDPQHLTIVDWDFSDINVFAIDLGIAIKQFCLLRKDTPFTFEDMAEYLQRYQQSRPLRSEELRILKAVLVFTSYPMWVYTRNQMSERELLRWVTQIEGTIDCSVMVT